MPTIPSHPGGYAPVSREAVLTAVASYLEKREELEAEDRLHGMSTAHRATDALNLRALALIAEGPVLVSSCMAYVFSAAPPKESD